MATRVTGAELKEVIETNLDESLLEDQFIATANLFINEELASSGLSDERLAKVELYLAAHFWAVTEERGGLVSESFDDASQRVADVYKGGLYMTRYGQMAITLDTSDTLSKFSASKKAQFRVV